jgi:hypothetical protein
VGAPLPCDTRKGFDQQHFDESGQHQIATRQIPVRLFAEQPDQRGQASVAVHVDHHRKQRDEHRRIGGIKDEITTKQPEVGRSLGAAMADFPLLRLRHHGIEPLRNGRLEARKGEGGRCRQEDEIALRKNDGLFALDREATAPLDHRAEAGMPEFRIAHGTRARTADPLREHGSRPEKFEDLRERVGHFRTIAN